MAWPTRVPEAGFWPVISRPSKPSRWMRWLRPAANGNGKLLRGRQALESRLVTRNARYFPMLDDLLVP